MKKYTIDFILLLSLIGFLSSPADERINPKIKTFQFNSIGFYIFDKGDLTKVRPGQEVLRVSRSFELYSYGIDYSKLPAPPSSIGITCGISGGITGWLDFIPIIYSLEQPCYRIEFDEEVLSEANRLKHFFIKVDLKPNEAPSRDTASFFRFKY